MLTIIIDLNRKHIEQDANFILEIIDPYSPLKTKKENLIKILELLKKYKPRSQFDRKIKYIKRIKNDIQFEKFFWNLKLYFYGLSTLPGFSVQSSIEKGRSGYDPEKYRITNDHTKEENFSM